MEVKKPDAGSLCNYEVLELLNELKDTAGMNTCGNHYATILYETSKYLQTVTDGQSKQDVCNLLNALLHFPVQLTHDEKLMIVNNLPRTALELSLMIHDFDTRLTEEDIENLLSLIVSNSA